jgi:hypothetical protein
VKYHWIKLDVQFYSNLKETVDMMPCLSGENTGSLGRGARDGTGMDAKECSNRHWTSSHVLQSRKGIAYVKFGKCPSERPNRDRNGTNELANNFNFNWTLLFFVSSLLACYCFAPQQEHRHDDNRLHRRVCSPSPSRRCSQYRLRT